MEYILKVTPKGQVTLPKKLRNQLAIQNLLSINLEERQGILKKNGARHRGAGRKFSSLLPPQQNPTEKGARRSCSFDCP